jgi:MFS family permease
MLVLGFVLYGSTTLLPLFLQTLLGYTAMLSGMVLSPGGVAICICMPLVGFLLRKFQPRWLVIFGVIVSVLGLLRMSHGLLPLARPGARFAPIHVDDVVEGFMRALADRSTIGKSLDLCGPDVMTLEQIVRLTARAASLPCHILRLPDFVAALQGAVMGMLPGKPFSSDNYRSLTIDSLCRQNGCETLGLTPSRMEAITPGYLSDHSLQSRLDRYRRSASR